MQFLKKIFYMLCKIYEIIPDSKVGILVVYKDIKFIINGFKTRYSAAHFLNTYRLRFEDTLEDLSTRLIKNTENKKLASLSKFYYKGVKIRKFNIDVLEEHKKNYMLGKVLKYIKKDSNVIDIGANTGMYSSAFSLRAKKVYSFEIVPPVYLELVKTSKKYKNIVPKKIAISNEESFKEFHADQNRLSNSGFSHKIADSISHVTFSVQTKEIDSYKFENISLIKIDTEGSEFDVLKGSEKLINMQKPACMIECYPKFSRTPLIEIYSFFMSRGYKNCFMNIKKYGLVSINSESDFDKFTSANDMLQINDGDFLFTT